MKSTKLIGSIFGASLFILFASCATSNSLELQYTEDKDTYVARFWTCEGVFDVGTLTTKENVRKMGNFPKFDVDFEHDIIVVHRPAVARALKAFNRLSL